MREFNRRQMAAAKSRRATPEELREARERLREIDAELQQTELLPETKNGEEREQRYERVLRLRAMRDEFARKVPPQKANHPNSLLLSLFMIVGSFLICGVCGGGAFFVLRLVTQKPDPVATGSGYWDDMKAQNYTDLHLNFLDPILRVQQTNEIFIANAKAADQAYGPVTDAQLISSPDTSSQVDDVKLTYAVTRNHNVHYNVTLELQLHSGAWGVSDLGDCFAPNGPGVPNLPTPTTPPDTTPTVTPVSNVGTSPIAALARRQGS